MKRRRRDPAAMLTSVERGVLKRDVGVLERDVNALVSFYEKDPEKFTAMLTSVLSAIARGRALMGRDHATLTAENVPPDLQGQIDTLLEEVNSASVTKRLMETGMSRAAAEEAVKRIDARVMEALDSFPGPEETRDIQGGGGGSPYDWVLFHMARFLSRRVAELIAQEAPPPRTHATIPSEVMIPTMMNMAPGHVTRSEAFDPVRYYTEDGALAGVTVELKMKGGKEGSQLTLLDPDILSASGVTEKLPGSSEWKAGVLALLPKMLGPEALALYYSLFFATDGEGIFPWHPTPFLKLLGLGDDSITRKTWSERLGVLTRVQLDVNREYEKKKARHDSGTLISQIPTFRTTVSAFPGFEGRRLEYRYFAHHPAIMESRRERFVRIPPEAFGLVGNWHPGRGSSDAGVRALSLLTTAYVFARMFASRAGKQGDETYRGAGGYEIPLQKILLASGFTTPERLAKNPGETIERAHEAIERLRGEFRLLGPFSDVKGARFIFDPTEELKTDLARIPKNTPAPQVIEAPKKKRARRKKLG